MINPGLNIGAGEEFGATGAGANGLDTVAIAWVLRGGAVVNAPANLPADLTNAPGHVSPEDILVIYDPGDRMDPEDYGILAAVGNDTVQWGERGPGGTISLHGSVNVRSRPRCILVLGRTFDAAIPNPPDMPSSAEIFRVIQKFYSVVPDSHGFANGFADGLAATFGKRMSGTATAANADNLGGDPNTGPGNRWSTRSSLDAARGGFRSCRVYADSQILCFGGCIQRTVPISVTRICAALTDLEYRFFVGMMSKVVDSLNTVASGYDSNYTPNGALENNPDELYAQLATLQARNHIGLGNQLQVASVREGLLTGRAIIVASILEGESMIAHRMLVSLDPRELDFPAAQRMCALGCKDCVMPSQNMIEKTGFNNNEELLNAFLMPSAVMAVAYAKTMIWSRVTPATIGVAWTSIRDVENVEITPDANDESKSCRKAVRDYGSFVAAGLRHAAGNAALAADTEFSILRLQRSFYDSSNVPQQGAINLRLDANGFVALGAVPMLSRQARYSEYRVDNTPAWAANVVLQMKGAKAGESQTALRLIVMQRLNSEPFTEPSTLIIDCLQCGKCIAEGKYSCKGWSKSCRESEGRAKAKTRSQEEKQT